MNATEPPIDPQRPIIDPHLHLWHVPAIAGLPQQPHRFLFDELRRTVEESGHNVTHTVFVECHAMYRADGPEHLRSLGETEFANGVAAMSASGQYGDCRVAHRIVGNADLRQGAASREVLEAHVAAAGERFRGIRMGLAWSEAAMFGQPCDPGLRGLMLDPAFREGAKVLAEMDLSLDVWCLHTQLGELASLADALPGLAIVLDHVGTPETQGAWQGREREALGDWSERIRELARRPNVTAKLGGMGMDIGAQIGGGSEDAPSHVLAERWRPMIETCIEAFGADRAMFESNFPPDAAAGSYGAVWNAFKRVAAGCSDTEKEALFRGTAARTYRIAID